MPWKRFQLVVFLILASLYTLAQAPSSRIYRSKSEWIEETSGTLVARRAVRVTTDVGPIHLQGTQQNVVTYTIRKHVRAGSERDARREFGRLRLITSAIGNTSRILGENKGSKNGSIDFDVRLPVQTSLVKIETKGGTITLDQISGSVFASSGGGDIEIGTVGGDVHVETVGGNIEIGSAGGRVVASSKGGALIIGAGSNMKLDTGGGAIHVKKCTGAVHASTGGGSIELHDVEGMAQAQTGGGAIRAISVKGGVRAETGGGAIVAELSADHGTFSDSRLETPTGDVIVYIPERLGIKIQAVVEFARDPGIITDFSELQITRGNEKWGPREIYAQGSLNGGGPVLHVHTSAGRIEFRKKATNK
ncbi:MAG TPA: hypothetical protein VG759_06825 [Candidatus Angelobacter sp.]|jgi:DUF4097 and DUF4098 domain-containing protein YvlB|nr:hypothetical protein [Candidatus Angelobacter sp.]